MTLKTLAMTVCLATGLLSSDVTAEAMPQILNQSSLTFAKHAVLQTQEVYNLQQKAHWASRFLSFFRGVGERDQLVFCVSDDQRAIVAKWRVTQNARYLIQQKFVPLGRGLNACQVWYHSGSVASAKLWSLSVPQDVLALGESPSWFDIGGMVQVNHTLDGTRFVVHRNNLAQASLTPDARMLKLFKDK